MNEILDRLALLACVEMGPAAAKAKLMWTRMLADELTLLSPWQCRLSAANEKPTITYVNVVNKKANQVVGLYFVIT